jgi:hypothetical protein
MRVWIPTSPAQSVCGSQLKFWPHMFLWHKTGLSIWYSLNITKYNTVRVKPSALPYPPPSPSPLPPTVPPNSLQLSRTNSKFQTFIQPTPSIVRNPLRPRPVMYRDQPRVLAPRPCIHCLQQRTKRRPRSLKWKRLYEPVKFHARPEWWKWLLVKKLQAEEQIYSR